MPTPLPTDENMGLTRPNLSDLVVPTGQTSLSDVQIPSDASAVGTPILGQRLGTTAVRTIDLADPNSGVVQTQVPSDSESDLLDQHQAAAEQMASQMGVLPPPAPTGKEKIVQHFPDGSFMLDNKVRVFPDGSNSYEREGQKFFQPRFGTPIKIPSQKRIVTNKDTGEQMVVDLAKTPEGMIKFPAPPELPDSMSADEAMGQLNSQDRAAVKVYASGDRKFPIGGNRNPQVNRLLPYILKVNPDWTQALYDDKRQLMMQYDSQAQGSPGWNKTRLNTAIDHVATLYDAANALDNKSFQPYNTISNWMSKKAGSPEVTAFQDAYNRVIREVEASVTGGPPHQYGIEDYKNYLGLNNSPAQFKAVLAGTIPTMMSARAGELGQAYEKVMHKPYPMLTPTAKASLEHLGIHDFYGQNESSTSTPAISPKEGDIFPSQDGKSHLQFKGKDASGNPIWKQLP